MSLYGYMARDSKLMLGPSALAIFNKFASPSAALTEKTMNATCGSKFLEHLGELEFSQEDPSLWKPFHISMKGLKIIDGIFASERICQETGERKDIPLILLKDYKKDIKIFYQFTKVDGTKIDRKTTISKKGLTTFLETLRLISDSNKPFLLYISTESLKDEYRTT